MGGSPSIPQRDLGGELGTVFKSGWPQEHKALNQWWQSEPLLSQSHDYALSNLQNVGGLTGPLMSLFKSLPGRLGDLYNQQPDVKTLTNPLQDMLGSLGGVYDKQIAPILNTGGALTPEQSNDVTQATRAGFAARGNVMGNQALGAELLNRDQFRQQRFGNALTQGLGISGEERGLTSGIEGLRSEDITNRLSLTSGEAGLAGGLASGVQGLQQGALNEALGTEQSQVGTFATLINPLLSFAGNLGESNQNAAAAQSAAGSNKTSGAIGGGISILGSVAAAY